MRTLEITQWALRLPVAAYDRFFDGDWRDHRLYAITREECPEGLLVRLHRSESHQSPHQSQQ